MSFPPSVTIKDYSLDGNGGYLNPRPGATPERFSTIIQIVPVLARGVPRPAAVRVQRRQHPRSIRAM